MKIAITQLSYADRHDLKREARVYAHRQHNADLGAVPTREHYRDFFRKFRDLITIGKRFDCALDRLDMDYTAMDNM